MSDETFHDDRLSDDDFSDVPQFLDDDALEDDADSALDAAEDDIDPYPHLRHAPAARPAQPPRPQTPPAPKEQSGFVNPALSRILAARPREEGREPGELWLGLRTLLIVIAAAVISSFIFNYWMPDNLLSQKFTVDLQAVSSTQGPATPLPSPLPTFAAQEIIGILTGHSGPPRDAQFEVDPGAVCDDGLTELEINTAVAQRVAAMLTEQGYQVEMLNEYDDRLPGYRATVLISIHTNTCQNFFDVGATGFNVEGNTNNPMTIDRDAKLAECIAASYTNYTGLPRHYGRPPDLVEYHVFDKISVDTPVAIVELGFMFADRQVLTERPDDMARGIVDGIVCFIRPNQAVTVPTEAPPPTEESTGT